MEEVDNVSDLEREREPVEAREAPGFVLPTLKGRAKGAGIFLIPIRTRSNNHQRGTCGAVRCDRVERKNALTSRRVTEVLEVLLLDHGAGCVARGE